MNQQVRVAVAVIVHKRKIFIAKRRTDQHQGGKWEFPGGKIEKEESIEKALQRELNEETGIMVQSDQIRPMMEIPFYYPDKSVLLKVCWVQVTDHQADCIHGAEQQPTQWVEVADLRSYEFPDANNVIIDEIENVLLD